MIRFLNINNEEEIRLAEPKIQDDYIDFVCVIKHTPFSAELNVGFSIDDLIAWSDCLKRLYNWQETHATLVSFCETIIRVDMDMNPAGGIEAKVAINAGSRGYMRFSYYFDASFLPEMINETQNTRMPQKEGI